MSVTQILLNKRLPKGHISCSWVPCASYLADWPGGPSLCVSIGPKNRQNFLEDIEILLPKSTVIVWQFRTAVLDQLLRNSFRPIRGQGGHLVFPISPKNTNLVKDIEILLPVKFHWILFSGFRGEVENVSANQRPGRPSCFSNRPEQHKLGRGRWDLPSCQVLLNSVQRFQRRSRECLSQSEARAAILFFRSAQKTQTW